MPDSPTSMLAIAQRFADLGGRIEHEAPDVETTLGLIAALAVEIVPSAGHAGITRVESGSLRSVGATSNVVERVDALQYELGSGPCVDAALYRNIYVGNDLAADTRWPDFGHRAADEYGVRSMMSYRIYLEQDPLIAALNLYADTTGAFTENDIGLGLLLATHGAIALAAASARGRASHLTKAVQSNSRIGMAIGIVMAQHKVTSDQAWDLLRITSQNTQRKVRDIAEDVIDTGTLPDVPKKHRAASWDAYNRIAQEPSIWTAIDISRSPYADGTRSIVACLILSEGQSVDSTGQSSRTSSW